MSRYIEADVYRAKWADIFDSAYGDSCCEMFKKSIDEQPTADVVEVAYGEWKQHNQGEFAPTYYCSNCEELAEINLYGEYVFSQYCPHCGAMMSESLKVHEIGKSLVDGIQAGIKGEKDGKIY